MMGAQNVLEHIVHGNGNLTGIATAMDKAKDGIVAAVQQLKRRGLVEIVSSGNYRATEAGHAWVASGKVVKAGQTDRRPRTATRGLRQRAWWVLRARKIVTLPELLSTLADGDERDARGNLRRYLKALAGAGFVHVLEKRSPGIAPTSNGHLRYKLVRDNGRLAPVVRQHDGTVFDPNSEEVFPAQEAR